MATDRFTEQNINNFINVFKQGARPNRFRVDLMDFPVGLELPKAIADKKDFYFYCKAASLPDVSVGVVEVPFMGRKFKVHGDRTFNEWTITVFNEEGNGTRRFFENWMHNINRHISNIRTLPTNRKYEQNNPTTSESYYGTFKVTQLRVDGYTDKLNQEYFFYYTFPSAISAIDLAFDSNDQVEEFTVTLQYSYWFNADQACSINGGDEGELLDASA
jgi:hypothetical protein